MCVVRATWRILEFHTPWNISGTAEVVKFCVLCQMLAFGWLTIPERGVARVKWSTLEFHTPLNFSGMAEDRIVKFCERVGLAWEVLRLQTVAQVGVVKVMWCLNFWRISVNISKTAWDRDILTTEGYSLEYGQSNGNNGSDLEWPWRSFTGCRPFQMQSVEHLCSILHD